MALRSIWRGFGNTARAWSIDVRSRLFPNSLSISNDLLQDSGWLGAYGERLAASHLKKIGYRILYRNFRPKKGGEIDLVCRHGDTLVFVEVKTRTSEEFGRPISAVDNKKRHQIRKGAIQWLRWMEDPDVPLRFDVVEIVIREGKPEVNVVENAFQPDIRF